VSDVVCELCHKPVRSTAARRRRIGSGCWRKLTVPQRAEVARIARTTRSAAAVRRALTRPVPAVDGQLPLTEDPT
jgi:hypothetical protein